MSDDKQDTMKKIRDLIDARNAKLKRANDLAKPLVDEAAALSKQIDDLARPLVTLKEEGSVSLDVLGAASVTFSRDVTRKTNTPAIHADWEKLPPAVQNIFKFDTAIDTKAMRALSEADAVVAAQYYSSTTSEVKMAIKMKVQQ